MDVITQAAQIVADADAILIGAGAGLSAAAGLDYTSEAEFAERFPGMSQYGARYQYQLMGYPFPNEALKWGYYSVALDYVYRAQTTEVYQNLRAIVGGKAHFVMTSNVDRYFHKNGFAEEQIFTPQGDYERFQCFNRCHDGTWDGKPFVAAMLPHVNRKTQMVEDPNTLPTCPRCGGQVFMNVRGGNWFVEDPYRPQARRFPEWLSEREGMQLALIEIGSGFNTPSVIRVPMETISSQLPNATLIRINRDHANGPKGTVSIRATADQALAQILEVLERAMEPELR
ncbi:hypothetical protein [Ruegeria atlantica]|uniref:hypothetical protein n=1 Tax=Ruegeria atlantica TaxID=81569 RepID=UPI00249528C1|nr:hypothetical protein [Ruegeria atlantica]